MRPRVVNSATGDKYKYTVTQTDLATLLLHLLGKIVVDIAWCDHVLEADHRRWVPRVRSYDYVRGRGWIGLELSSD